MYFFFKYKYSIKHFLDVYCAWMYNKNWIRLQGIWRLMVMMMMMKIRRSINSSSSSNTTTTLRQHFAVYF